MYSIILEKSIQKFLKKHIGDPLIQQFTKALRILAIDPYTDLLDIKKLI